MNWSCVLTCLFCQAVLGADRTPRAPIKNTATERSDQAQSALDNSKGGPQGPWPPLRDDSVGPGPWALEAAIAAYLSLPPQLRGHTASVVALSYRPQDFPLSHTSQHHGFKRVGRYRGLLQGPGPWPNGPTGTWPDGPMGPCF